MPQNARAIETAPDVRSAIAKVGSSYQPIGSPRGGLQLYAAKGRGGRVATTVRDENGRTVSSTSGSSVIANTKTCWKCAKDKNGDVQCWVIDCPELPAGGDGTVRPRLGGGGVSRDRTS